MEDYPERARREGTPLIDGERATFVWLGVTAPQLIGDFNRWGGEGAQELRPVAPGLWAHTLALPRDAYVEYAYVAADGRVPDPLNPRTVGNGIGGSNHWFRMPDAVPSPLQRRPPGQARGRLTRHVVAAEHHVVGGRRTVWLYRPPSPEPAPLLVVFDGQDYLRQARLAAIVDNLFAGGRMGPLALALVASGGQARFVEYACSESTLMFLAREVLPLARAELNLLDPAAHPGAYGVLGASMGGLMALYTALRLPEVFGHVLCQSGAFSLDVLGRDLVALDLARHGPARPLQIWMDVGRLEFLLEANRRVHALLRGRGYAVAYREFGGGHNWTSWRDDVWRGLEATFGPEPARATADGAAARAGG